MVSIPLVTLFIPVQISVLICTQGKSQFAGGLHERSWISAVHDYFVFNNIVKNSFRLQTLTWSITLVLLWPFQKVAVEKPLCYILTVAWEKLFLQPRDFYSISESSLKGITYSCIPALWSINSTVPFVPSGLLPHKFVIGVTVHAGGFQSSYSTEKSFRFINSPFIEWLKREDCETCKRIKVWQRRGESGAQDPLCTAHSNRERFRGRRVR